MSRFLVVTISAIALVAVSPLASNASIGVGNLVFGVQNELEDDDFDQLVNGPVPPNSVAAPGAGTTVDVGDFLTGIFRITSLRVPPGGPQIATATDTEATFTAIFATKVLTKTVSAGGVLDGNNDVNFTFTAPTLAEWAALFAPVPGAPIATAVGTVAVVFADPDNIDQTAGLASYATVDGTELWEFGFLGLPGEIWTSNTDTDDIATAFAISTGNFTANLNVTEQGAGPFLAPQPLPSPPFPAGAAAQVFLRNGSIGSASPGAFPPFPVSSDVDVLITPIPEPIAIITWSGLIATALVIVARRRRCC